MKLSANRMGRKVLGSRSPGCLSPLFMAVILASVAVHAISNGVARTPPMGWSTFNQWGGNWDAPLLKMVGDSLVSTGLKDCGYVYVNCDGSNGQGSMSDKDFFPESGKFVAWMKPVADYLHAKGLRMGVYNTTSTNPTLTAQNMVSAGIDYLKHDDWGSPNCAPIFKQVSDAIVATQRPIVYSTNSCHDSTVCHVFRTGGDIYPSWDRVMGDYDQNYPYLNLAGPGHWPDPDMLEVGCRPFSTTILLSYDESRAHFSMWCMMSAPLIIGFDVTRTHILNAAPVDEFVKTIAIFSNTELIALDQDTVGLAGKRIRGQGALEVWLKNCADGSKAVALLNRTGASASMSITQAELGFASGAIYVRDLWLHADQPTFTGTFTKTVASHAAEIYKMDIKPISRPTDILRKMDRSIAWLKSQGYEVFPQRMIPSVLLGVDVRTTAFDMRGRALSVVRPAVLGSGVFYLHDESGRGKNSSTAHRRY